MSKQNVVLKDRYKSTKSLYPKINAKSLSPKAIEEITKITEEVVEEQVVPNPTPTGEEPNLEYITINNVTYKVPTGSAQVQANWNETDTDSPAYIQNKPTIPSAQVQSNWNETDTTSPAYIQNKPTIPQNVISYRELMKSSVPLSGDGTIDVPVNEMQNTDNYVEVSGYAYVTGSSVPDRKRFTMRIKQTPYSGAGYVERPNYFIDYNATEDASVYIRGYFYYNISNLRLSFSSYFTKTSVSTSYTIVIEHIKEIINY